MDFRALLSGGNKRQLKGVDETIQIISKTPTKFDALFNCLFDNDEIVRMRAADAIEKICRQNPSILKPYKQRLLSDVTKIDQASVRWHLAQILSEIDLDKEESIKAVHVLKRNLDSSDDWIVINLTLQALVTFYNRGVLSKSEFKKILNKYTNNKHKSVRHRVEKISNELN